MDPFETIDRIIEEKRKEADAKEERGFEDKQLRKQLLDLHDARDWIEAETAAKDREIRKQRDKAKRIEEKAKKLARLCSPIFDPSLARWIADDEKEQKRIGQIIKKMIRKNPSQIQGGPPRIGSFLQGKTALGSLQQETQGGEIVMMEDGEAKRKQVGTIKPL